MQYESCDIAMLIRSLLEDERITGDIRWEPSQETRQVEVNGQQIHEKIYGGAASAAQFRDMHGLCPRHCKFLALTAYEDETWLSENGYASCKPFVIAPSAVSKSVFNQVFNCHLANQLLLLGSFGSSN